MTRRATSKPTAEQAVTSDRQYRKLRARYRAACERVGAPCWLCGQPIDYGPNSADAWEVDHLFPRSSHPQLHRDVANFRPSHGSCNRSRGNSPASPTLGVPSREW